MPTRQQLDPRDPIIAALALRDDDGAVLELASEIADVTGAPLALAHAYPYQAPSAPPAPPEWANRMRAEATGRLERLAAGLRDGVPATVHVKANPSPVRALHEIAEELGASLIVAGSSHRGAAGRVLPGGVGERLLHAAPCSVAIAPRGYERPPAGLRRIGVAFRDGPEGAAALAIGARLAAPAEASVTTYTVATGEPFDIEASLARARRSVPAEDLEDTVVLHGDPAAELTAVSAGLDLLICGSRGYGPVRSLVVGGVSWELAHRAHCPLLVVPRATTD
jgi:nucleotide-binding universal stress UspA family protein